MAKEKGEKTNLYLLSIVAIVAIVGIVVLILNSGTGSVSLSSDDLSGEAFKISTTKSISTSSLNTGSVGTTGYNEGQKQCCRRTSDGCACMSDDDGNCGGC